MHVAVTVRRLVSRSMATRPSTFETPSTGDARLRKFCWIAIAFALLLGAYVGTLAWATRTVEAGVARSIQPLPALIQDRPELGR